MAGGWGWAGGGAGRAVGAAATRRADGDLVRAAARLDLPLPASGPGAGGTAGPAGVRGRSTPGICQVCARHIDGDPERAASTSPAARASASSRAGGCRRRPPPSSAHLRLNMVRELPRWHRHPDMLSRTVINTQDSRPRSRAYRRIFASGTHGVPAWHVHADAPVLGDLQAEGHSRRAEGVSRARRQYMLTRAGYPLAVGKARSPRTLQVIPPDRLQGSQGIPPVCQGRTCAHRESCEDRGDPS